MERRVALFVPSLAGGGAQRVMVTLANELAARGVHVDLIASDASGPYTKDVNGLVNLIDFRTKILFSIWPLARYLRRQKPVAILSTLTRANLAVLVARQVSGVDTRVLIRIANVVRYAQSPIARERILLPWLMRRWYHRADVVVAVSDGVAKDIAQFARLQPGQVRVVNNPIAISQVLSQANAAVDHPWYSDGSPPVILAVGRLSRQKDFATLIRAFSRVSIVRETRLIILGEGPERANLENLVRQLNLEHRVSLPGFARNPYAYLSRSAVFVLSSKWEGFPNVLLEAMAVGVPVVATDCQAGPAELLLDGKLGNLVPVGDEKAMSQAILKELERGPGPRNELRERASQFSVESIATEYSSLLLSPERSIVIEQDQPGVL